MFLNLILFRMTTQFMLDQEHRSMNEEDSIDTSAPEPSHPPEYDHQILPSGKPDSSLTPQNQLISTTDKIHDTSRTLKNDIDVPIQSMRTICDMSTNIETTLDDLPLTNNSTMIPPDVHHPTSKYTQRDVQSGSTMVPHDACPARISDYNNNDNTETAPYSDSTFNIPSNIEHCFPSSPPDNSSIRSESYEGSHERMIHDVHPTEAPAVTTNDRCDAELPLTLECEEDTTTEMEQLEYGVQVKTELGFGNSAVNEEIVPDDEAWNAEVASDSFNTPPDCEPEDFTGMVYFKSVLNSLHNNATGAVDQASRYTAYITPVPATEPVAVDIDKGPSRARSDVNQSQVIKKRTDCLKWKIHCHDGQYKMESLCDTEEDLLNIHSTRVCPVGLSQLDGFNGLEKFDFDCLASVVTDESTNNVSSLCNKRKKCNFTKCRMCLFVARGACDLYRHEYEVHQIQPPEGVRVLNCDMCPKMFFSVPSLNAHRVRHVTQRPALERFPCEQCGQMLTRRQINTHIRNVHLHEQITHTCSYCGLVLANRSRLNIHYQKHKQNRFICPIEGCSKELASNERLKQHVSVCHEKIYNFPCLAQGCAKRFANQYNMRAHLRQHTGVEPFKCRLCDCSFKHNVSLKTHVKSKHPGYNLQGELLSTTGPQ